MLKTLKTIEKKNMPIEQKNKIFYSHYNKKGLPYNIKPNAINMQ